jgi:hypothetical protein
MANKMIKETEPNDVPWGVAATDYEHELDGQHAYAIEERQRRTANPEEIQPIHVEEEDRLAFRVGVNLITLGLIGAGIYFLLRMFMAN